MSLLLKLDRLILDVVRQTFDQSAQLVLAPAGHPRFLCFPVSSCLLHIHLYGLFSFSRNRLGSQVLNFLKFFLPATHLTIWSFACRPQFFVVGRTVTNLSLPFASVQHVLFCSNFPLCFLQNFCRTASDFLQACFVKQSVF